MAKLITLSTPDSGVVNGMELSFKAPCDCSGVTGISLANETYALVDASGSALTSCSGYFVENAILTVIIDTTAKTATLLNPRVNTYTKSLGTSDDTASATGTTVWARVKQLENDVAGKAPSGHTHSATDITGFSTHTHDDRYYTEGEIDAKLSGKSDSTHDHDSTYYTKNTMDNKLAGKADYTHDHNATYYQKSDVDDKLDDKANKEHTHDDRYYTQDQIDTKLDTKSDTTHDHNTTYYTKDTMDSKLDGKADTSHNHDDTYALREYVDDKFLLHSLNGHTHDERYYTISTMDSKLEAKADIEEVEKKLEDKAGIGHSHTEFADADHTHTEYALSNHNHPSYAATTWVNNQLAKKANANHTHEGSMQSLLIYDLTQPLVNNTHDPMLYYVPFTKELSGLIGISFTLKINRKIYGNVDSEFKVNFNAFWGNTAPKYSEFTMQSPYAITVGDTNKIGVVQADILFDENTKRMYIDSTVYIDGSDTRIGLTNQDMQLIYVRAFYA